LQIKQEIQEKKNISTVQQSALRKHHSHTYISVSVTVVGDDKVYTKLVAQTHRRAQPKILTEFVSVRSKPFNT